MPIIAVVGGQWGDEGKGKIVDLLSAQAQLVIRAHGGDNAGHTVVNPQGKFALRLVPAGIFNPSATCIIGTGVALNPAILLQEMELLHTRGVDTSSLVISERAHLVMPYHLIQDEAEEEARGDSRLGTTKRGIGPTYVDKVSRIGLRAGDLRTPDLFREKLAVAVARKNLVLKTLFDLPPFSADAIAEEYLAMGQRLVRHIQPVEPILERALAEDAHIVIEGAHASLLDIDYGTYPYVTTSSPTVAGMCLGAGIGPRHISTSLGIFKTYCTRVGAGPFPTELHDEMGATLREKAQEYGTTTGRPRRCGWFDVVAARHSVLINGFDYLALTRLDILTGFPMLRICTAYELDGQRITHFPCSSETLARCQPVYEELAGWQQPLVGAASLEELPAAAQAYICRIEGLLKVPAGLVGTGAERHETIITAEFGRRVGLAPVITGMMQGR